MWELSWLPQSTVFSNPHNYLQDRVLSPSEQDEVSSEELETGMDEAKHGGGR